MTKTRYYPLATFEEINYVLIDREQAGRVSHGSRFVAAWAPIWDECDPDMVVEWGQGHYFGNILDACRYIEELLHEGR